MSALSQFLNRSTAFNAVEFYNSTPTLAALRSGVTLLTNAANQTSIISDIIVSSNLDAPMTVSIGGTEVVAFSGSSRISGDEVVPPSGTATIRTTLGTLFNRLDVYSSTSTRITCDTTTIFDTDRRSVSTRQESNTISPALTTTPTFACFDGSGNFYYSNASGTTLYRRSGGVNGAETSFAFATDPVYDGTRFIYAVSSTQLLTFDTQTGALGTARTITVPSGVAAHSSTFSSTYNRICVIDGFVISRPNYTSTLVYVINSATGAAQVFPVASLGTTYRYQSQIGKRTDGTYVYVDCDTTAPSVKAYEIGRDLLTPRVTFTWILNPSLETQHVYADVRRLFRSTNPADLFWITNNYRVLDLDARAVSGSFAITNATAGDNIIPTIDSTREGNDFGTPRIRVTGYRSV